MEAGVPEMHSSHKSVSHIIYFITAVDLLLQVCENACHSSTKPLVGTGCLLKLLFFDMQPIVMHGLGHD